MQGTVTTDEEVYPVAAMGFGDIAGLAGARQGFVRAERFVRLYQCYADTRADGVLPLM